MKTARLIIVIESASLLARRAALEDWLEARAAFPGNFMDQLVDASEFADVFTKAEREAMAVPDTKRAIITKSDRAPITDFAAAREKAVIENVEWLGISSGGTFLTQWKDFLRNVNPEVICALLVPAPINLHDEICDTRATEQQNPLQSKR